MTHSWQRLLLISAALVAAVTLTGCKVNIQGTTDPWPGCKAYLTQEDAQNAWTKSGRSGSKHCKSLPTDAQFDKKQTKQKAKKHHNSGKSSKKNSGRSKTTPSTSASSGGSSADKANCKRTNATIAVPLDRAKYPETILHVQVAIERGYDRVLRFDRGNAEEHRAQWAPLVRETRPGKDRDEWPMASSDNPDAGRNASIAYIDSSDNRGAGSTVGGALRAYCSGTKFEIKPFGKQQHKVTIVLATDHGRKVNIPVTR